MPVATALQLAAEAHLSTIVHAATGAVISCGDARRFATPAKPGRCTPATGGARFRGAGL